jgi:hypothetical protein
MPVKIDCCLDASALNGGEKFFTVPLEDKDGVLPAEGTIENCKPENVPSRCRYKKIKKTCQQEQAPGSIPPAGEDDLKWDEEYEHDPKLCNFPCCDKKIHPMATNPNEGYPGYGNCVDDEKLCKYKCCSLPVYEKMQDKNFLIIAKPDTGLVDNAGERVGDPNQCEHDHRACSPMKCCLSPRTGENIKARNEGMASIVAHLKGEQRKTQQEQYEKEGAEITLLCTHEESLCEYDCCDEDHKKLAAELQIDEKDIDNRCIEKDVTLCGTATCCLDPDAINKYIKSTTQKSVEGPPFVGCTSDESECRYYCCTQEGNRKQYFSKHGESVMQRPRSHCVTSTEEGIENFPRIHVDEGIEFSAKEIVEANNELCDKYPTCQDKNALTHNKNCEDKDKCTKNALEQGCDGNMDCIRGKGKEDPVPDLLGVEPDEKLCLYECCLEKDNLQVNWRILDTSKPISKENIGLVEKPQIDVDRCINNPLELCAKLDCCSDEAATNTHRLDDPVCKYGEDVCTYKCCMLEGAKRYLLAASLPEFYTKEEEDTYSQKKGRAVSHGECGQ